MNKTKIEWCDSTWNPVTGCRLGCAYCYAKGIARRYGGYASSGSKTTFNFMDGPAELDKPMLVARKDGKIVNAPYPFGFEPTLHRYRLDELARKTKPRTIFVGSMTDLFGQWVPTKWIVEVLDACQRVPQHRYLFLTKNPQRYIELDQLALLPRGENFWYGSTVTTSDDTAMWVERMDCHWFVSMEPLHGGVDITGGDMGHMPEWVIIGAETGSRKDKIVPELEWVDKIVSDCRANGIPVFMKNSIKPIWGEELVAEFPW